jgi:hypothetical protein
MKSVLADPSAYDCEGDEPPHRPLSRTIIYEVHARGFTRHPSSGVAEAKRGTYAGVVEKIPYLEDLGITSVELLPVFQFDAQDCPGGLLHSVLFEFSGWNGRHSGRLAFRLDKLSDVQQGGFAFRWSDQLNAGHWKPFARERNRHGQRRDAGIVHCHGVLDVEKPCLENSGQKPVSFRWCLSENG